MTTATLNSSLHSPRELAPQAHRKPEGYMRYITALGLGFVVAVVLFGLMNALIRQPQDLGTSEEPPMLDFVRVKQEETLTNKSREVPKKPPPKRPPPPPEMEVSSTPNRPQAPKLDINAPKLNIDMDIAVGNGLAGFSKANALAGGGATALNTFDPQFPRKAARAGKTGSVVFQYTIQTDGSVGDVVILKERPRGYDFGKSVKVAAAKWRFKPAVEDGKPIAVTKKLEFEFTLE